MGIRIDNERQLNVAQDFVNFIREHNKRALAKQDEISDADDVFDIAVRQAGLINSMAKALAVKQTEIGQMKSEIDELRTKINDLEREIRVSKDLLAIAKVVKEDDKC